MIAFLLSSALWSDEPTWAFKRAAVMAQTTAFGLYLASRFSVGEQLRVFSTLIVIALVVFAASALLDPVESFSTPGYDFAFRGPLPHKNEVARLMALATPALLLHMGAPGVRRWGRGSRSPAPCCSSDSRIPRRRVGGRVGLHW